VKFDIGITEIVAVVSLVIAVIGAVLGILNYIHRRSKDKVKLRITPPHIIGFPGVEVAIEVINLGGFPVTIEEVGLILSKKEHKKLPLVDYIDLSGKSLPCRLGPREELTLGYSQSREDLLNEPAFAFVKRAYARTACGETHYGTSGALKGLIKEARKLSSQRLNEIKERWEKET